MATAQKFRVETVVADTQSLSLDHKVHSKETIKEFTRLFIENILYERKLLKNNNFYDYKFHGVEMKRIRENSDQRLAKHLPIYFQGIEDAINKGLLQQLIFRICRKGDPNDCIEEYDMSYRYYPEDNPKSCAVTKSVLSIQMIMNNMKYCINKYFQDLPSIKDLDVYIYIKLDDEKTPDEYIAPHFAKTSNTLLPNDDHYECALGTLKTSYIKIQGRIEGYPRLKMKMDSKENEETIENSQSSTNSLEDSTIIIPDEEELKF